MDTARIRQLRCELLADVKPPVLEIGIGSGLNIPCYPPSIRKISAVDINPGMKKKALRRMKAAGIAVDLKILNGERLPFDEDSFESVVVTFALCSIEDVSSALCEMRRVLKPSGRLYFLEHGLCPETGIARWQKRLNPLQKKIGDGCQLDRDIPALVSATELQIRNCRSFHCKGTPKTHGWFYLGVGEKLNSLIEKKGEKL